MLDKIQKKLSIKKYINVIMDIIRNNIFLISLIFY